MICKNSKESQTEDQKKKHEKELHWEKASSLYILCCFLFSTEFDVQEMRSAIRRVTLNLMQGFFLMFNVGCGKVMVAA